MLILKKQYIWEHKQGIWEFDEVNFDKFPLMNVRLLCNVATEKYVFTPSRTWHKWNVKIYER